MLSVYSQAQDAAANDGKGEIQIINILLLPFVPLLLLLLILPLSLHFFLDPLLLFLPL